MLEGNASFNAKADATDQAPVYFADIAGIGGTHYATAPIFTPSGTHKLILGLPRISPGGLDLLEGSWTVSRVVLPFLDVGGEASILFGSAAPGAPVTSWKNRVVTLYGGYRDIGQVNYVKLFTGRVTGLRLSGDLAAYELELADPSYLIDGELCTGATDTTPTTIRGNVVNVFVSLLRGVFSTSDPDFPLEAVSTTTGSSSAPTGLGIPDADLDFAGMKAERDLWRPDDTVELELRDPVPARGYLQTEFFRAFQARVTVLGNGLLGFRFNKPATALVATPVLDLTTIARLESWEQLLSEHLNKFTIRGDHDPDAAGDEFSDLYAASTAEDTADRTATGETVEYLVESQWLRSIDAPGLAIAEELAARLRLLWLNAPSAVTVSVNFRQRRLESGDIVSVTHPDIPNQRTGVRGVTGRYMTVVRSEPDLDAGRIKLELLDVGLQRFGGIAPSSKTGDYSGASSADRETFAFVCNSSEQMPDGSPGYQLI